ncbi:MAG TPA: hypothetical protein VMT16_16085, partial [Thermoanaerobaculia bacterium]|nr:hypothetical protein [Thermoanaerobaculia bacterium]
LAAGGVSMDLVASPELARLAGDPRFASLLQAMERNRAPIARAEIVCELDAPGLLPEGIDLDRRRRRVVLGSFSTGQLVTAALDGSTEELLPAGRLGGVAGIRVDPVRRVVWATSNSDGEGEGPPPAVVAVGLDSGDVVARKELAAGAAPVLLNDLAVTPDGTVFVTETLQGAVLRTCLACPGLELLLRSDRLPLANGITTGGDGTTLYVAHAAGISRIDTTSGAEEWLAVPPGEVSVGADGLYWHEGTLIAVQNQPFHDRIVRFWLDEAGATILRTQILNGRHPGGMFHSTGFVLDGHFFFNGVAGGLPPPGGLEEQRTYLLTVPLGDPPHPPPANAFGSRHLAEPAATSCRLRGRPLP